MSPCTAILHQLEAQHTHAYLSASQAGEVAALLAARLVPPLLLALAACGALARLGWPLPQVLSLVVPLVVCWAAPLPPQVLAYAHRFGLNESLAAAITSTGSGVSLAVLALTAAGAVLSAVTGSLLPFCGMLAGVAGIITAAAVVLGKLPDEGLARSQKVRMVYNGPDGAAAAAAAPVGAAFSTEGVPALAAAPPGSEGQGAAAARAAPPEAAASRPPAAPDVPAAARRSGFTDIDGGPASKPPSAVPSGRRRGLPHRQHFLGRRARIPAPLPAPRRAPCRTAWF